MSPAHHLTAGTMIQARLYGTGAETGMEYR